MNGSDDHRRRRSRRAGRGGDARATRDRRTRCSSGPIRSGPRGATATTVCGCIPSAGLSGLPGRADPAPIRPLDPPRRSGGLPRGLRAAVPDRARARRRGHPDRADRWRLAGGDLGRRPGRGAGGAGDRLHPDAVHPGLAGPRHVLRVVPALGRLPGAVGVRRPQGARRRGRQLGGRDRGRTLASRGRGPVVGADAAEHRPAGDARGAQPADRGRAAPGARAGDEPD